MGSETSLNAVVSIAKGIEQSELFGEIRAQVVTAHEITPEVSLVKNQFWPKKPPFIPPKKI